MKAVVLGIIVLMVGSSIVSAINGNQSTHPKPMDRGWLYVGGSGPGNYTKIQDAINASSNGDTVYVYRGIYFENIILDKSIHLYGEDRNSTYIDGSQHGIVINIKTNPVHIEGFSITRGTKHGIYSETNSYNIVISSCRLFENNDPQDHFGQICLFDANECVIYENIVFSSDNRGIALHFGSNNEIYQNVVYYNSMWGAIDVIHCSNNSVYENIVHSNYWGISINNGSHNRVFNNTVYYNQIGIMIDWPCHENIISDNNATANTIGINIGGYQAEDNIISNNTINYGTSGIHITSEGNTIQHNQISNTNNGIGIESTSNNYVIENYLNKSGVAILILNATDNQFLRNTFIDGARVQAFFLQLSFLQRKNHWEGNYWDSPRFLPKPIFGIIKINYILLPWLNFDWRPAQEPYYIP